MNCYNGEQYLNEAVDSVLNQTYSNWEIIFWDNQSTDNSRVRVQSYNDPRIKYYLGPQHVSLGEARNLAIDKSSGEYICFLDIDDIWDSRKLEVQVNQMLKYPDTIVSYSYSYEFHNSNLDTKKIKLFLIKNQNEMYLKLLRKNFINWQTVMINNDIASNFLKFDDRFNLLEDLDVLIILSLKGEFRLINQPLVYYRLHDSNLSHKRTEMLKERLSLLKKYKYLLNANKILYYKLCLWYHLLLLYRIIQNITNDKQLSSLKVHF